jgi:hypothetical protein
MADVNDIATKQDEIPEDNDADTSVENSEQPEPTAPAIDTKSINSRLDGLEDMITRVMGQIEKISAAQSVLVESGAIVDTSDDQTDNDGIDSFNDPNFGTLDMCITD